MATPNVTFDVPLKTKFFEATGSLSIAWQSFFQVLFERVYPLGAEKSFEIVNNQAGAADITGLRFDYRGVSQAAVDYLIQRVTTGGGAVELIETGTFRAVYRPTSNSWDLVQDADADQPDNSGVVLSITSTGQVQYTSTNTTGTAHISKFYYRARTLAGKHSSYSSVGVR